MQGRPSFAVDVEGLRLPPAPIEREHELAPRPLAQWLRRHERLELGHQLGRPAYRQVRVDSIFERSEPELLEPSDLTLREVLVREIRQSGATPEAECLTKHLRGSGRIVAEHAAPFVRQALETPGVEVVVCEREAIAGRQGLDRRGAERPPEPGYEVLKDLGSRRRGRASPQLVDEPIRPDSFATMQRENGEQRALPSRAEGYDATVVPHLERAEDTNLHAPPFRGGYAGAHSPLPRGYRKMGGRLGVWRTLDRTSRKRQLTRKGVPQ